MFITTQEAETCSPEELIDCVRAEPTEKFLEALAQVSAICEKKNHDSALFSRLGCAVLGVAFVESAGAPSSRITASPQTFQRLFRLANGIPTREPDGPLGPEQNDLHESNCRLMVRLFAQHEAYLGPLKPALARTEILLRRTLPAVLNGRPNPLGKLPAALGVSFDDARAALLGAYAWTIRDPADTAFLRREHFAAFAAEAARVEAWSAINAFAETPTQLHARRTTDKAYGYRTALDFRYAFPVLRDRPLVRLDDALVTPVARHLALCFSDGIYDFLRAHLPDDGPQAEGFDAIFGDVTDAYVRERFARELGTGAYVPLPEVPGTMSPDGVDGYGETLFELKGKRLLRGVITTGDIRAAKGFLGGKRSIGRGVAQLLAEVQRTRSGAGRGLRRDRLDDAALCLVTPDGFPGYHLEPVKRWVNKALAQVIRDEFPDVVGGIPSLERLEWLSFDDLDRLVRAARLGGCSVGRLLRRFRLEAPAHPVDAREDSIAPSIRDWLYKRDPRTNEDAWFDEAFMETFDDCAQRVFGERLPVDVRDQAGERP